MDTLSNISITVVGGGGGAADLVAVGVLLELKLRGPIVWIDPDFNGGRLDEYKRSGLVVLTRECLCSELTLCIAVRVSKTSSSTQQLLKRPETCPTGTIAVHSQS